MSDHPIFWHQTSHGYDADWEQTRLRDSYIYWTEHGAVEGWRTPTALNSLGEKHYGGIEVHSKKPLYTNHKANPHYCQWTRGTCFHDGSSLAFEQISTYFNDPEMMFSVLAEWAESNLPKEQSA